jgi:transcription-repair coupling factor (superfamily II helicase)
LEIKELNKKFENHPKITESLNKIKTNSKIYLRNLIGSSSSIFASTLINKIDTSHVFVLSDKEEAAYFHNDLTIFLNTKPLFFPTSYKRSIIYGQEDSANLLLRAECLQTLAKNNKSIIVTYPEALVEKVVNKENLINSTLNLGIGEDVSIEFIQEVLEEYDFQYVDFVYEPGQFSIRGSIIDVFSFASDFPYRVDFFGDEVESIRSFDIENQLSKESFQSISILPNIVNPDSDNQDLIQNENIFSFINNDTFVWIENSQFVFDRISEIEQKLEDEKRNNLIVSSSELKSLFEKYKNIEFGQVNNSSAEEISFSTSHQPSFNKNFQLLGHDILSNIEKDYSTFILSENLKQIERLENIFNDINTEINFKALTQTIHSGFIDHDLKVCLYTDHQIFGKYHKFRIKNSLQKKEQISFRELTGLHPGDYIVHIDHGIGKFGGLEKIDINGKIQEAIKLVYKDQDTLYVSIHALHKISKYKGKDAEPPKIYKLGSGAWQKLKQNTKNKVKDIAKELILLYAKRKEQKGFAYTSDTYLQNELESSFIYDDTPDQIKSTISIKQDMESDTPMDRLVCGDVGFGKTEIAIRAAFKAVADNKQVAVLVPTTILALQHYQTFKNRLKDFPCNINYISRLRSRKQQTEIIKDLADGKVDILIGTHKIVSNEINFKDLGLLIIDEEQKFGVSIKEKLKRFKVNVDTLTLTATPIPRTLQFSMMGARDLSIINTPPPNRYPIVTELHTFNEDIIKEAIDYEFQRNGQVFFIHNRVQNIAEVEILINKLCPDVRTVFAHGQMEANKLEKVMLDFINYEYDVLIATTIIESGLDIPNANTIIINNAQNFGLSDLHQLRGRVGRSNKKAFCYLLAPPLTSVTQEARRRLKAIEEFSELGSGFNIAMQDLDIRGAGNLLGAEQSGFITDIGFETYHRILNEAILELKESSFKELYSSEQKQELEKQIQNQKFISDCHIDTDMELLFPDNYISNISERVRLYRELDNIETEENLNAFQENLIDRFGNIPSQTSELINVVRLRWNAIVLGIEKIILKNKKMVAYFISDQESAFYKSLVFSRILNYVQENPKGMKMKELKGKLIITFENVHSISESINKIKDI